MSTLEDTDALALLEFWFKAGMSKWFAGDAAFDEACARWGDLWRKAADGGCEDWRRSAAGSLALIILTDQIPRNIFRGDAKQFSTDAMALDVAEKAVAAGHDKAFPMPPRVFFYTPYEHSEDMAVQERGLDLVRPLGSQDFYYWMLVHADAIRRFGRFPHRNKMLGRQTTEAEQLYLDTGGFGA